MQWAPAAVSVCQPGSVRWVQAELPPVKLARQQAVHSMCTPACPPGLQQLQGLEQGCQWISYLAT